jgi:trypsin-like peptidase
MRRITILVATAIVLLGFVPRLAAQADYRSAIFLVEASDCVSLPLLRIQTGFLLEGTPGLVTALHGVTGCATVSARQPDQNSIAHKGLRPRSVDIEHDVVLLEGPTLPSTGGLKPHPTSLPGPGEVRVVGHPAGIAGLWEMELQLASRTFMPLSMVVTQELYPAIAKRASPGINIEVLGVNGNLQPGHSGAPILDSSRRVLGVASGGLGKGALGIGWAIPLSKVHWAGASAREKELNSLAWNEPALVFAYDETVLSVAPPVIRSQGSACIMQSRLFDLDRGDSSPAQQQGDLFFAARTNVERVLEPNPWSTSTMAIIGGRAFDRVTLEGLRRTNYQRQGFDASRDERNRLPAGTVLAVRTSDGRFAKVKIVESHGDVIRFDWLTYALPGEGPSPQVPSLEPCGFKATLLCGSGALPGDEIQSFSILNRTPDGLEVAVRYRFNTAHGTVYLGTVLLDKDETAVTDGYQPASAPPSGESSAVVSLGRGTSRFLLVWLYERYKSEAFACRQFDYRN